MRRILIGLGCASLALLIAVGVWGYRHWWAYYRLFFANTAAEMTHEERARALAQGGTDALHMLVERISDEDQGAARLALDALEIMHSDAIGGREVLYQLMSNGNEDALNMVMYVVLRGRLDRQRHPRLYQEYHPDRVVEAVEAYTNNYSKADPNDLGRRALAALRAEYDALLQATTIRQSAYPLRSSNRYLLWWAILRDHDALWIT